MAPAIKDDAEDVLCLVKLYRGPWHLADGQIPVTHEHLDTAEADATEMVTLLSSNTPNRIHDLAWHAYTVWRQEYDLMALGRCLLRMTRAVPAREYLTLARHQNRLLGGLRVSEITKNSAPAVSSNLAITAARIGMRRDSTLLAKNSAREAIAKRYGHQKQLMRACLAGLRGRKMVRKRLSPGAANAKNSAQEAIAKRYGHQKQLVRW